MFKKYKYVLSLLGMYDFYRSASFVLNGRKKKLLGKYKIKKLYVKLSN